MAPPPPTPPRGRSSKPGPPERKAGDDAAFVMRPARKDGSDARTVGEIRTRLPKKQLEHFRELLLRRRAEIIGDVTSMETGALRGSGSGELSHVPLHMADVGSDTFDQEFTLQLAATERLTLTEIDAALKRIDDGTFGICEVTGQPISLSRLEAKPWARVCIEVARERDRHHRMVR